MATVMNFATGGPVWVAVGMFSLYHLYLAAGNSTTIEGWEKDKVATLIRRGKIRDIKYPYVCAPVPKDTDWQNIGFVNNLKSVLGPNPLLWLWPQPMQVDGLSYPVNPDAGGESAVYDWAGIAGRSSVVHHDFGPDSLVPPLSGHREHRSLMSGVAEDLTHIASGSMPSRGAGKDRFRLSRGDGQADDMV